MIEEPPVISIALLVIFGLMGLFSGIGNLPVLFFFIFGIQTATNFETPVMEETAIQDPAHESQDPSYESIQ